MTIERSQGYSKIRILELFPRRIFQELLKIQPNLALLYSDHARTHLLHQVDFWNYYLLHL